MKNQFWAVGCGLGWTVKKKVWTNYEQLLREVFVGKKKKKIENIVASALKSCIEKKVEFFFCGGKFSFHVFVFFYRLKI